MGVVGEKPRPSLRSGPHRQSPTVIGTAVGPVARSGFESRPSGAMRRPLRSYLGVAVRLTVLAGVTLVVPQLVWNAREKTISQLAQQYAPEADSSASR